MLTYINRKIRKARAWMNYSPPGSMSSKGWRLFDKEFKERAPIRYWLKSGLIRRIINPIRWRYNGISDWFRYRTTHKYHIIDTGLVPGYYEIDTLMLHGNFNMLKDFVEVSQARHRYYWSDDYRDNSSWCEKHMPFYSVFYPFRRPDLGIAYLDWASTLDDPSLPPYEQSPSQAVEAREIKSLYLWWVKDRPARKEIEHVHYDNQGLGWLSSLDEDFDRDAEDYKAHVENMVQRDKQAADWEAEDQDMLIRLMKIRKGLWT